MGVKDIVSGFVGGVKGTVNSIRNFRPIGKNEEGKTTLLGGTGFEWVTTVGAILTLYLVVVGFFIALLAIGTNIRGNRLTFPRPGDPFEGFES